MPLSKKGLDQAREMAGQLKDKDIGVVYTSPLLRAHDTARIIADLLGVKLIKDKNLRELDQGKWDGLTVEEIKTKFGRFYEKWYNDPFSICPPGGETIGEAKSRAASALKKIFKAHRGDNICLVTHQIMSALISYHLTPKDFSNILDSLSPIATWDEIGVPSKVAR